VPAQCAIQGRPVAQFEIDFAAAHSRCVRSLRLDAHPLIPVPRVRGPPSPLACDCCTDRGENNSLPNMRVRRNMNEPQTKQQLIDSIGQIQVPA